MVVHCQRQRQARVENSTPKRLMIDPTKLKAGDVVVFGGTVEKTVGSIDWSSPSGQVLIAFGAIDSWHCQDDPLWKIAELKPRLLDPDILAKAIPASYDWLKTSPNALDFPCVDVRDFALNAYCNGFCQGFHDAREEKNGG